MPHDVIMPALGMAQQTGKIVSWLKQAGDPVALGEPLMEVETDKATMEVEAQAAGYLGSVSAAAGEDVPVGAVVARIADTAEEAEAGGSPSGKASGEPSGDQSSEPQADAPKAAATKLPEGATVIMPALGMTQDTGRLVAWAKQPGEAVAVGDTLFEVETDKSTMEVEADKAGWLAAVLAAAGDDVPVGETVAIISKDEPDTPVVESYSPGKAAAAPAKDSGDKAASDAAPAPAKAPAKASAKAPAKAGAKAAGGRILASPKARRLALQEGLDLSRLVEAGYAQPYHVKDLETLRALPALGAPQAGTSASARLTARVAGEGLQNFCAWVADEGGSAPDEGAVVAGFAAASLSDTNPSPIIAIDRWGARTLYCAGDELGVAIGEVQPDDGDDQDPQPALLVRDLRDSRLTSVQLGAEEQPVITLTREGADLAITLEYAPGQLSQAGAIALLEGLSGRLDMPLRHLL
jgi:pyruvate/2-oxoglutarate dehydrogenase complex dihydrolipoamide acyltransferase (E2) component